MTIEAMGVTYIERALFYLQAARQMLAQGAHPEAVRQAQEVVELCFKGILRLMGIEFPKTHDAAQTLPDPGSPLVPDWMKPELARLREISRRLADQRGPAFYGDEKREIPSTALFGEKEGGRAVADAEHVHALAVRFLEAWRRREDFQRGKK